jgi:hypothetical protein
MAILTEPHSSCIGISCRTFAPGISDRHAFFLVTVLAEPAPCFWYPNKYVVVGRIPKEKQVIFQFGRFLREGLGGPTQIPGMPIASHLAT